MTHDAESKSKEPRKIRNRILWNYREDGRHRRGEIDEIVMSNVDIHIEQMNDGCWWMGIYSRDDPEKYWMGNIHTLHPHSRARLTFTEQENAGIEWDDDDSHEQEWRRG